MAVAGKHQSYSKKTTAYVSSPYGMLTFFDEIINLGFVRVDLEYG